MDCILFYLPQYRQKWVAKKLIEDAEATFESSFYAPGNFTLRMPADDDLIAILKEQCMIVPLSPRSREEDVYQNPFIVEKVYMNEDEDKGKNVTLSGRTADAVLGYRVLGYLWEDDGEIRFDPFGINNQQATDIILDAFNEVFQVYAADYIPRKIPWVRIASLVPERTYPRISVDFQGENFLEVVNEYREKYKFGIKADMIRAKLYESEPEDPDEWFIEFTIYKPKNFTGTSRKVLSAGNGDVDSTDYNIDKTNEINAVIALGVEKHGEVIDDKPVEIETEFHVQSDTGQVGFFRKEDYEDLKGVKIDALVDPVTVIITEQASTFLAKPHEKMTIVESDNCRYKCKIDYDLGDRLIVRDEFGNYGKVRCTKITEVFDYGGYRCIPTFDEWEKIPVILRTHSGARFLTSDEKQIVLNGGK